MGTHAFAVLLLYSLWASQVMMVVAAWVLQVVFNVPSPMHTCTVGFGGVMFALKYVLSRRSPGTQTVSWTELAHSYCCDFNGVFFLSKR